MAPAPFVGWMFLAPDAVPERWRDRVVDVKLVPLAPDEARGALVATSLAVDENREGLFHMIAAGLSLATIARRSGVSTRTIQRRLSAWQDAFGVTSKAELALELARHGFGLRSDDAPTGVSTNTTRGAGGNRAGGGERFPRPASTTDPEGPPQRHYTDL